MKTTFIGILLFCAAMMFSSPMREMTHSLLSSTYQETGGRYMPSALVARPSIRAGELGALRSRLYSQLVAFRREKVAEFERKGRAAEMSRATFMNTYPPISATAPELWPALENGDVELSSQVTIKRQIERLNAHEGIDSTGGFRRADEEIFEDWRGTRQRSDGKY